MDEHFSSMLGPIGHGPAVGPGRDIPGAMGPPLPKKARTEQHNTFREEEQGNGDGQRASGLSQQELQKILDSADSQEIIELDSTTLKHLLLRFERRINKNQQLRVKYADQPAKFMESELDLCEEISKLKSIAASPHLYEDLANLNGLQSILSLISHENTDVSIEVIKLLAELTDAEALPEREANFILDAIVNHQGLELLVQNLSRLDEQEEEDAQGVYFTLQIIENLADIRPSFCLTLCERTQILKFLLQRIQAKKYDANKLYASEILCVLLQADVANQRRIGELEGADGLEALLKAVHQYRRKDPETLDEEECVENLFDSLCSALMYPPNRVIFRQAEGFELLVRFLKEKRFAWKSSIKVLDYALMETPDNCDTFVEVGGLKLLFPAFLGRSWPPAARKSGKDNVRALEEHLISILSTLFMYTNETGDYKLRLLGKLIEKDLEKVDRLMELYEKYKEQVLRNEQVRKRKAKSEEEEEEDDDAKEQDYLDRLEAGLFQLQKLALIIAQASVANSDIKERVGKKLREIRSSPDDLRQVLAEYADHLGDLSEDAAAETGKMNVKGFVRELAKSF